MKEIEKEINQTEQEIKELREEIKYNKAELQIQLEYLSNLQKLKRINEDKLIEIARNKTAERISKKCTF